MSSKSCTTCFPATTLIWVVSKSLLCAIPIHFVKMNICYKYAKQEVFVVISDFYIRTARRRPELLMHNNRLWKRGCGKGNNCGIANYVSELII